MLGGLHSQSLEVWSFLSGTTDPIHNVAIPLAGTLPLSSQLKTRTGTNVTGTTSVDVASANLLDQILLSSSDWLDADMEEGDYLYLNSKGYKILQIQSSKNLVQLKYALTTPVTNANILVSKKDKYRSVTIVAVGTADTALVNGIQLKAGQSITFDKQGDIESLFYTTTGASDQLKFILGS